jgi:hypothetical protein
MERRTVSLQPYIVGLPGRVLHLGKLGQLIILVCDLVQSPPLARSGLARISVTAQQSLQVLTEGAITERIN